MSRRSPRQGLWVAALLLAIGVIVPLLAQLWQGTSGTPAASARAAAGAPGLGKTADVSARVKKAARAPVGPAAERERAPDPQGALPSGADVPLFSAVGPGARVERAQPSTSEGAPPLQRPLAEEPRASTRASNVDDEQTASAPLSRELGALPSGATSVLSTGSVLPAKSEQRVPPARREPFSSRLLERNPYMRR